MSQILEKYHYPFYHLPRVKWLLSKVAEGGWPPQVFWGLPLPCTPSGGNRVSMVVECTLLYYRDGNHDEPETSDCKPRERPTIDGAKRTGREGNLTLERAETRVAGLPGEDAEDHHAFPEALIEELKPVGELEAVLADRIVSLAWRLRRAAHVEAELFRRKHHDRFVTAAMNRANSCGRSEMQDLLDQLDGTVRDEEAHDQALREAEEARALRDAEPNAVAAAFEWDSSDIFSKLARYETSIERSLYKAIYEVERLQAARSGSSIGAAVGDLNVDTGQAVS